MKNRKGLLFCVAVTCLLFFSLIVVLNTGIVNERSFAILSFLLPASVFSCIFTVFACFVYVGRFEKTMSSDIQNFWVEVQAFQNLPKEKQTKEKLKSMISRY